MEGVVGCYVYPGIYFIYLSFICYCIYYKNIHIIYCAWSTEMELVQQACLMVCSPVVYTIVV